MTQPRATYAWAVLYPLHWERGSPGAPVVGSVAETRQLSMGRWRIIWGTIPGESASACWKRAYRKGWRLARVSITPALGYGK